MNQVWYHGTTSEAWRLIQREQMLWGKRSGPAGARPQRCTYLTRDLEEARQYGSIILRVTYAPTLGRDNYEAGCWQIRVYDPIPLWDVELIKESSTSGVHRIC